MTEADIILRDRFALAALSVCIDGKHLQQPELTELAWHLYNLDQERLKVKGKSMSDDHLRQEAAKWSRAK